MMPPVIERRPTLAAVAKLLEAAALPTSDLTDAHMDHFFYSGPAPQPIGIVGLEVLGKDALLRSLVVVPGHRNTGLGVALTEHAEQHARALGIHTVYLMTMTAESFFAHRGYVRAARESAPELVRATRQFADICPASCTLMVKHLA